MKLYSWESSSGVERVTLITLNITLNKLSVWDELIKKKALFRLQQQVSQKMKAEKDIYRIIQKGWDWKHDPKLFKYLFLVTWVLRQLIDFVYIKILDFDKTLELRANCFVSFLCISICILSQWLFSNLRIIRILKKILIQFYYFSWLPGQKIKSF